MSNTHKYDVGYTATNRQGFTYKVVVYRNTKDVDVQFEDGLVIEHVPVTKLNQNTLFHPDYPIPKIKKTPAEQRLGEKRKNKQGRMMTVVEYRGAEDIDVEFESGFIVKHTEYQLFERGHISDPFYPSLYGVGYMGMRTPYGKSNQYARQYEVWSSMLKRCYNENCQRHQWYEDCVVDERWHNFATFLQWWNENYYELPEGMGDVDLDKDIKFRKNRIYGPDTCLLVPATINRMLYHRITSKTGLPLGVTYDEKFNRYRARGRIDKKDKFFGFYNTVEEAFDRVKNEKEKEIRKAAELYKPYIPEEVYNAVISYQVMIDD
jgi:hypothetical protein